MQKALLILSFIISATQAAIIEPLTLWDKNDIHVCFYDDVNLLEKTSLESKEKIWENSRYIPRGFWSYQKDHIKKVVNLNYTEENTGIHFTGWETCSQVENPDIIIIKASGWIPLISYVNFSGRASIGKAGILEKDESGNTYIVKSDQTAYVSLFYQDAGTIVHEFGHIAGLRHEHINEKALEDPNCQTTLDEVDLKNREPVFSSAEFLSEYDPQSIMNYCWIKTQRKLRINSSEIILSPVDQALLKSIYY